ncbi:hypothetical protein [Gordonia sp. NPDC003429]
MARIDVISTSSISGGNKLYVEMGTLDAGVGTLDAGVGTLDAGVGTLNVEMGTLDADLGTVDVRPARGGSPATESDR